VYTTIHYFFMESLFKSMETGNPESGNLWVVSVETTFWNMSLTLLFPALFVVNNKINERR